ncbi:MAG: putative membrane protein [Arenicella sp.]|jgi:uncharacterized membrane protein
MSEEKNLVIGKKNVMFIIIGLVLTLVGFFLMIGGGSDDPNVFDGDEMFSNTRITISPLLVICGYGLVIYGIMKKNKVNSIDNESI